MPRAKKTPRSMPDPVDNYVIPTKNRFSVHDRSGGQLRHLRQQLMVDVARAIKTRGWTQAQAARFLGVSQPRISDLVRGHVHLFSLDVLVQWLSLMGERVVIFTGADTPPVDSRAQAQEQIEYYSRVIALDPTDWGALTERGYCYSIRGQHALAVADYSRCMELAPERPGPRFNRAYAYMRAGEMRACMRDCNILLEEHPDLASGWVVRGKAHLKFGDRDKALADFNKAIELEPALPDGYEARGALAEEMGDTARALADYQKAVELQPSIYHLQHSIERLKAGTEKREE